ncbi:hypothetical protein N657DRAFT_667745 [Parathielavia appendiculata]|uniref:Uncharacterized protein n=1 Tax=Parathielavia appendiculata TaxID=2587402 RepID=A0AAN6U8S1_9PEZI|nr:hypothetical protein N657DRAFT_667745 [Parathielavia appendiculata]
MGGAYKKTKEIKSINRDLSAIKAKLNSAAMEMSGAARFLDAQSSPTSFERLELTIYGWKDQGENEQVQGLRPETGEVQEDHRKLVVQMTNLEIIRERMLKKREESRSLKRMEDNVRTYLKKVAGMRQMVTVDKATYQTPSGHSIE